MYMTRSEIEVTLGRAAEFEALVEQVVAIQQQQAGYIGSTLLQSFGTPGRHTLTARWTDRQAARASVRSSEFVAFAPTLLNSGLFRPVRLAEAYESVFEVDADNADPARATCEVWIDWTLKNPIVAPAFEAFSLDIANLAKQHSPGFVSSRLRRYLGTDLRYLALAIGTDRAAARARLDTPELRAYLEGHSYTDFAAAPPTSEAYEVVNRYVGPAAAQMQSTAAAATP